VSDRADLVAAKLHARLVPVSLDRLVAVRDAYRPVVDAQQPLSASGDVLRAGPAPEATPARLDASPPDPTHPRD